MMMRAPVKIISIFVATMSVLPVLHGTPTDLAANATNEFGLDLHRRLASGDQNLCISPYSIESVLAMTFAGAEGDTRIEMARVLHFPEEGEEIHSSFQALRDGLTELSKKTEKIAQESKTSGGPSEPIRLSVANRLFAQQGYEFRDVFKQLLQRFYAAPIEQLDFKHRAEAARDHINKWIADQTLDRIRDLIPPRGVTEDTRLVLTNAIYLKAPWAKEFNAALTTPKPFHVRGGDPVDVPTMTMRAHFRYAKRNGYVAIALPYSGDDLQFLVLVPDDANGLHTLEAGLNADALRDCSKMPDADVELDLPKFKMEPPTVQLKDALESLGMKTAFDNPPGSANFDRMAVRKPNDYLAISNVFHKTFIAVDEHGTEAAAATAVVMMQRSAMPKPVEPIRLKVDRPFFYAVQHVPSGACLFVGRVTDPR